MWAPCGTLTGVFRRGNNHRTTPQACVCRSRAVRRIYLRVGERNGQKNCARFRHVGRRDPRRKGRDRPHHVQGRKKGREGTRPHRFRSRASGWPAGSSARQTAKSDHCLASRRNALHCRAVPDRSHYSSRGADPGACLDAGPPARLRIEIARLRPIRDFVTK
jgi:hypothetical protein